jgi:hypothetical protein
MELVRDLAVGGCGGSTNQRSENSCIGSTAPKSATQP